MIDPAITVLYLRRNGELVIFFWETFAVLLHDLADGDPSNDGWGNGESFAHDVFLNKKAQPQQETGRHKRDRKSVVWGTSVSERVDIGGGRIIKKKNNSIFNGTQCVST